MNKRISFTLVTFSCLTLGYSSWSEKSYGCYELSQSDSITIVTSPPNLEDLCMEIISVLSGE